MKFFLGVLCGVGLLLALAAVRSCTSSVEVGPYGGDVVALSSGHAKAEVVSNADTGEVMVHTWDQALQSSQSIESRPLVIGSGDHRVELQPRPTASDPAGSCSRFYGQAEWSRGAGAINGWLAGGASQTRQEFAWTNRGNGHQSHSSMWGEMGAHRRGMTGDDRTSGMMGHDRAGGMHHE